MRYQYCDSDQVVENGYCKTFGRQTQRYRYRACRKSFQLEYLNAAYKSDTADKTIAMTLNGSGIRDIRRVSSRHSYQTIYQTLQKKSKLKVVNPTLSRTATIGVEIDEE